MGYQATAKALLTPHLPEWIEPFIEISDYECPVGWFQKTPYGWANSVRAVSIYPTNPEGTTVRFFNQEDLPERSVTLGGSEEFKFLRRHCVNPHLSRDFVPANGDHLQAIIDKVSERAFTILITKLDDFRKKRISSSHLGIS